VGSSLKHIGLFGKLKMNTLINKFIILLNIFLHSCLYTQPIIPDYLTQKNWDSCSQWIFDREKDSILKCSPFNGIHNDGICFEYHLSPGRSGYSYVRIIKNQIEGFSEDHPIALLIKANAHDDIELKFVDEGGSVFGKRYSIRNRYHDWNHIIIYLDDTQYWWGGDSTFGKLYSFEIAFSGDSSGTVWIDEIGIAKPEIQRGLFLDPYRESAGLGFLQRRDVEMNDEDPLVLKYLKVLQDYSSSDGLVLPNNENTTLVSTFNNSLAAMVFIIKNQKERAENILDFYAAAADSNNQDCTKQAFFCKGEMRGFYQQIHITDYTRGGEVEDRWIGDMAWLMMAYKHYEKKYGQKSEYRHVVGLIRNLLISFYKAMNNNTGYIQTGWQDGDTRFDTTGHVEGNIGCYAALKHCGEDDAAEKVRNWLNNQLIGNDLPLDNYTWRALAFCEPDSAVINIPEFDFRFKKKIYVDDDSIYGFYPFPNISVNNIWTEGIGHMACAQWYFGERSRGYYYANQFDPLLLSYDLYGNTIRTLPYAVNRTGEFTSIDTTTGSVSSACWYVFAKNGFNPLCVDCNITNGVRDLSFYSVSERFKIWPNFPNPFNSYTKIVYRLREMGEVTLKIYNIQSQLVRVLVDEVQKSGEHTVLWDGLTEDGVDVTSGVYFYRIECREKVKTRKMVLLK
jgi:hypothetical protein